MLAQSPSSFLTYLEKIEATVVAGYGFSLLWKGILQPSSLFVAILKNFSAQFVFEFGQQITAMVVYL